MASIDLDAVEPMPDIEPLDLEAELADASDAASPGRRFRSVLFRGDEPDAATATEPACFGDLNLDRVVESVVAGRDAYDLRPFFFLPLRDAGEVEYRHEVFRDLAGEQTRAAVQAFAREMQQVRRYLALTQKQYYELEKERWLVDAAEVYCHAVSALEAELVGLELGSSGLQGLREHVSAYTASDSFTSLASELRDVLEGLGRVRYTLRIKGARVTVRAYQEERDYSVEVEETFARFRQGAVEDHLVDVPDSGSMDHVEARIAQLVARLYPREFRALGEFCARWRDFLDPTLVRFDREVQFYLAYLEHADWLAGKGLPFCYPIVSTDSKELAVERSFDLALAAKLAAQGGTVVCNDFALRGPERVLVVTGPNQGGKTTFARMVGQVHYLATLGVPVPGRRAHVFLPDRVLTHFEREEDIRTLRGKLDDELVRVRDILEEASGESLLILNEIFASTTLADALYLGREVLGRVVELGCLAVCVTFVDELASLGEATVSMVASVAPEDPSQRTFEIVRRPADGRAYAWALADKYGLSYERLRERIGR
jgi:DNA mismatch repair protein MutS